MQAIKCRCRIPSLIIPHPDSDVAAFPVHHLTFPFNNFHVIFVVCGEIFGRKNERFCFESLVNILVSGDLDKAYPTDLRLRGHQVMRRIQCSETTVLVLHNGIVIRSNDRCANEQVWRNGARVEG